MAIECIKKTKELPDGSVCYRVTGNYDKIGVYRLNGQQVVLAFMGYTGSWYAFNTDTGEEVGNFRREFYDKYLKNHLMYEMKQDKDKKCGCPGN